MLQLLSPRISFPLRDEELVHIAITRLSRGIHFSTCILHFRVADDGSLGRVERVLGRLYFDFGPFLLRRRREPVELCVRPRRKTSHLARRSFKAIMNFLQSLCLPSHFWEPTR